MKGGGNNKNESKRMLNNAYVVLNEGSNVSLFIALYFDRFTPLLVELLTDKEKKFQKRKLFTWSIFIIHFPYFCSTDSIPSALHF